MNSNRNLREFSQWVLIPVSVRAMMRPALRDRQRENEEDAMMRARLYCMMLANGMLRSQGWTVGELAGFRDGGLYLECWPVAPNNG